MGLGIVFLASLAASQPCPTGTTIRQEVDQTPPATFPKLPSDVRFRITRRYRPEHEPCSLRLDWADAATGDARFGPRRWAIFNGGRATIEEPAEAEARYRDYLAEPQPCDAKAAASTFFANKQVCASLYRFGDETEFRVERRCAPHRAPTIVRLPYRYDSITPDAWLHVSGGFALGRREGGVTVVDVLDVLLD